MCLLVPCNQHSIKTNKVFKGRFLQELSGLTEGLHDLINIIAGTVILGTVIFFSDDNFNVLSPNGSSWIMCSLVMKSRKWSSCVAETYILGTLRV